MLADDWLDEDRPRLGRGAEGRPDYPPNVAVAPPRGREAKHRGPPANLLVRLAFGAPTPPPVGVILMSGGKPVGRVTTAVPGTTGPIGRGSVRYAVAKSPAPLTIEGGGTARIL